jgi:predicted nucleotidyltransferase
MIELADCVTLVASQQCANRFRPLDELTVMATTLTNDPVLVRFRKALDEMYGNRLDRVVLFGSCARGDARDDSDYDVAVFLKTLPDRWEELDRLAQLRVEMIDATGAFFDAKPYAASTYAERLPLMHEIRLDGLDQ